MELYFVEKNDKETEEVYESNCLHHTKLILRGEGYKNTVASMKTCRELFRIKEVCSNDETLLNCPDFWNEEKQRHDIYFWRNGKWVLLQDLIIKELRQPHNLTKMYMAELFDED